MKYKVKYDKTNNTRVALGKIDGVKFGIGGYQDAMFGLSISMNFQGMGCGDFISGGWAYGIVDPDKYCKWSESDRSNDMAIMCKTICEIMKDAGVSDVTKLVGKPIEAMSEGFTLQSWRVLTEVL